MKARHAQGIQESVSSGSSDCSSSRSQVLLVGDPGEIPDAVRELADREGVVIVDQRSNPGFAWSNSGKSMADYMLAYASVMQGDMAEPPKMKTPKPQEDDKPPTPLSKRRKKLQRLLARK